MARVKYYDPKTGQWKYADKSHGSGGNVDLTGYATEQFVRDGYQPKGDYLESTALPTAINTALAQAKDSGEFDGKDGVDGKDGYTPVKDVDYFDGKDGADGKSAYSYAKDAGYTGTEDEFAEKLASDTSGIHIGAGAPTDEDVNVWIDTDEEPEEAPAGKDGKSAYEYAREGGYTGTEAEFAAKLAEDYPQPDWNASADEAGYIKNRTHYSKWNEFMPSTTVEIGSEFILNSIFKEGLLYKVNWNGTEYIEECFFVDGSYAVGNVELDGNGSPFVIFAFEAEGIYVFVAESANGEEVATLSIEEYSAVTIPEMYIPDIAKPYIVKITEEELAAIEGNAITSSVSYDKFAEHVYKGGRLVLSMDAGNGVPVMMQAMVVNYISAEKGMQAFCMFNDTLGYRIAFPNGTWTPPTM